MQQQIKDSEIEFMEFYSDPTALTECLVPENYNAPQTWPRSDCITLRNYQFAMQNYSYMIADDPKLSPEDNFRLKKASGDLFTIGSRNTGKSFYCKIDIILAYIHGIKDICLASFDDYHLKKIASPIADFLEHHKFLKIFHLKDSRKESVQRTPLNAKSEHGSMIESANEHIKGNNPGEQFHAKHFNILYYEEYSYASEEGFKKRIDSGDTLGYIFRPSGIPDLCIGSPLGKILIDKSKKNWLWQLPQMVRSDWTETVEQEKAEEYKGKQTAQYKLNVLAETLEGAFGFFDMGRLKESSFKKGGRVKFFEVGKENFSLYENILHVDRLASAEQVYICADLGFGAAPTEIVIIFFDGKKFKYEYNISLQRLTPEEQPEIFFYLYKMLGSAYIALDSTSDSGAMIERLAKLGVSREHLLAVKFNKNIEVGFEKDENDEIKLDSFNDPIMKQANTEQWSYSELERTMYNGEMQIPPQEKFENQFTNVICKKNKTGVPLYQSKGENHLVQAFQCFVICKFFNQFNIIKNELRQNKRAYCSFTKRKQ